MSTKPRNSDAKSIGDGSPSVKRGERSASKTTPNKNDDGRPTTGSGKSRHGSESTKGERSSTKGGGMPAPIIKTKSEKSLTSAVKGSEKSKRKKTRSHDMKKKGDDKKKKSKTKRKSLYEKMMLSFGFYVGAVNLTDPRAAEAAQALDLKPWHLKRLRVKFDQIDIDGSGNIDFDEFFEAIGELRSPFTDKLFALIDMDGSGTIEFDEFVRTLATYCMFTKDEILRFCFECFDVDRSGTIDEKEFVELCKCVNNASPSFPNNFKNALEQFDVNEDGLIDYGEFVELDRRYPLVLFPGEFLSLFLSCGINHPGS
jgi:Ca2+-binding EF-hand superfamily protein